jgi:hypothetical protein
MTNTEAKIVQFLQQQTEPLREFLSEDTDEQIAKLRTLCANFGCQSGNVAALVSIATGKRISYGDTISPELLSKGTVVVAVKRGGGHTYGVNKPAMVIYDGSASYMLKPDGTCGNDLPLDRTFLRAATPAEVEKFVEKVGLPAIQQHLLIIT